MGRLFIAVVAAMAMLAFASVAYSKGEGAQQFDCAESFPGTSGTIVVTPSGNANYNCNYDHPRPSHGGGATVYECSNLFGPGVTGNIVVAPSGHFKSHCKFPESV